MKRFITLLMALILLSTAARAVIEADDTPTLVWWTVGGGGGMSSDSRYTLQATIGQADAGAMGNDRYNLLSGYWDGPVPFDVYLPIVIRP